MTCNLPWEGRVYEVKVACRVVHDVLGRDIDVELVFTCLSTMIISMCLNVGTIHFQVDEATPNVARIWPTDARTGDWQGY